MNYFGPYYTIDFLGDDLEYEIIKLLKYMPLKDALTAYSRIFENRQIGEDFKCGMLYKMNFN